VHLPVLDAARADFEEEFRALALKRERAQGFAPGAGDEVRARVAEIVEAVRTRGDEALLEFTERFDGCRLSPERLRVSAEEMEAALHSVPEALLEALREAAERIRRFQEAVLVRGGEPLEAGGRTVCLRYVPVDSAGICVPGATASLASSVLMGVVPAVVAGVKRIVMITPPRPDGSVSPDRLAAARIAGAHEVYRVFGAQGVAALAFGTQSIPAVDFIAGPGNAYVTTAKRAVFGQVGIDMPAGPSEVAVVADGAARAEWVAAEMLAQAEHGGGSATLVTCVPELVPRVCEALESQSAALERGQQVRAGLQKLGAAILAPTVGACAEIVNRLAPEHLVIMTREPAAVCEMVRHAGAIFLGHHTPVAAGDYVAGPSHCLPTGTSARFCSGLTANTFLKSTSIIRYTSEALERDAEVLCRLARAEGLEAHAHSVGVRLSG